jgi:hypothetical protein
MNLKSAKLLSIRPYQSVADGGDVLLIFEDGQTLICGEDNLLNEELLRNYVAGRLHIEISNELDVYDDWREFLLGLWVQAPPPPASIDPQGIQAPQHAPLATRDEPASDRTLRPIELRAATIDETGRSVEAVLATQGRVRTYIGAYGVIEEVLIVAGAQFPDQVPLLDSHARYSVGALLGSVRNIRTEGEQLVGRLYFVQGDPTSEAAWQKVRQGHLTDVSIGYQPTEYVDIAPGMSSDVRGLSYSAGTSYLRVTTQFNIKEASLTPIGADPASTVREGIGLVNINTGARPNEFGQRDILAAAMLHRAGLPVSNGRLAEVSYLHRGMTLVDVAREALRLEGKSAPRCKYEMARAAVSSATLANVIGSVAIAKLLATFDEEDDSTVGWIDEEDVPNFRPVRSIALGALHTPKLLPRNREAEHQVLGDSAREALGELGDSSVTWKLARYAKMFVIDDQDLASDGFNALLDLPEQMGRSCRRLRPDLVYSLLLANAATSDGVALFHASHSNTASDLLADAGLKTGAMAISEQQQNGVRLNLRARTLIVPPSLRMTGADLTQRMSTLEPTPTGVALYDALKLRSDARLGASGVVDPTSGVTRVGSNTNWFLASKPGRTIRLRFLDGTNRKPKVRSGVLKGPEWGIWIDCCYDLAAAVLDYPGLYRGNT